MFKILALITKRRYWLLHSVLVRALLRVHGIRVGRNFYMEGVPQLKINGRAEYITIGDNVRILGDIDLRNRENGKIVVHNDVTIEGNCRFVSAREGVIKIGKGSIVTTGAIINGGANVIIGESCIIGPRASINANEHVYTRNKPIREQGFLHKDVIIEDDCWVAANVVLMKGIRLRKGSVIGANAVVTKDTAEYSINVGIPAKEIAQRS